MVDTPTLAQLISDTIAETPEARKAKYAGVRTDVLSALIAARCERLVQNISSGPTASTVEHERRLIQEAVDELVERCRVAGRMAREAKAAQR